MSTHMIAISDLDNALITHSFDTSNKLLKMWLDLITKSDEIGMLVFLMKKDILIIFKQDLD